MKKLTLLSLFAMLLLFVTGCVNTDAGVGVEETLPQTEHVRFFGMKPAENETRGVAQYNRIWPNGSVINYSFLNGSPELRNMLKGCMAEWTSYANIEFQETTSNQAYVRIGFETDDARWLTWSYVGMDCFSEMDPAKETLHFDLLQEYYNSGDMDKVRGDMLRGLGLVLGLELENRHPNFSLTFSDSRGKTPKDYWEEFFPEVADWDAAWSIIESYVLTPLVDHPIFTKKTTTWDPQSIMNWPYPNGLRDELPGGPATDIHELSDMDKEFIATIYPGRQAPVDPPLAKFTSTPNNSTFWNNVTLTGNVTGEWNSQTNTYDINGDQNATYTVTISGTPVNSLQIKEAKGMTGLTISNSSSLTSLYFETSIPSLKTLDIQRTQLALLDISNCGALRDLTLKDNSFNTNLPAISSCLAGLTDWTNMQSPDPYHRVYLGANDPVADLLGICEVRGWEIATAPKKLLVLDIPPRSWHNTNWMSCTRLNGTVQTGATWQGGTSSGYYGFSGWVPAAGAYGCFWRRNAATGHFELRGSETALVSILIDENNPTIKGVHVHNNNRLETVTLRYLYGINTLVLANCSMLYNVTLQGCSTAATQIDNCPNLPRVTVIR